MRYEKSQLELRTKPSVEDGLAMYIEETTRVTMVDYQPGNGTRYCFLFVMSPSVTDINRVLGFGDSWGWIITDLNSGRTMRLGSYEGKVWPDEVKEKLSVSESDAYVLAELFGRLLGMDYEEAVA